MRIDPDGVTWLKPEEWIPWLMANHPDALRLPDALDAPPDAKASNPRREGECQITLWETGNEK